MRRRRRREGEKEKEKEEKEKGKSCCQGAAASLPSPVPLLPWAGFPHDSHNKGSGAPSQAAFLQSCLHRFSSALLVPAKGLGAAPAISRAGHSRSFYLHKKER